LLCVDTGGWIHITYADEDTVDYAAAVRRRVGFLLRNPHIIPTYSLVECNCECIAMWCKTGRWVGALMEAASSNGGGDGRKRGGGAKERSMTQQSNRGDGGGRW